MDVDPRIAESWLTRSQFASAVSAVLFVVVAGLQLNADWIQRHRADWLNRKSRWIAIAATLIGLGATVTGIYFGRVSARIQKTAAQNEQTILNTKLASANAKADLAASKAIQSQIALAQQAKELGAVTRFTLPPSIAGPKE